MLRARSRASAACTSRRRVRRSVHDAGAPRGTRARSRTAGSPRVAGRDEAARMECARRHGTLRVLEALRGTLRDLRCAQKLRGTMPRRGSEGRRGAHGLGRRSCSRAAWIPWRRRRRRRCTGSRRSPSLERRPAAYEPRNSTLLARTISAAARNAEQVDGVADGARLVVEARRRGAGGRSPPRPRVAVVSSPQAEGSTLPTRASPVLRRGGVVHFFF